MEMIKFRVKDGHVDVERGVRLEAGAVVMLPESMSACPALERVADEAPDAGVSETQPEEPAKEGKTEQEPEIAAGVAPAMTLEQLEAELAALKEQ